MAFAAASAATVAHCHGERRPPRPSTTIAATVAAPPMARYCTLGVRSHALAARTGNVTTIHQATAARVSPLSTNALSLKRDDRSGRVYPERREGPLPPEGNASRRDRRCAQARSALDRPRRDVRATRPPHAAGRRYHHRR